MEPAAIAHAAILAHVVLQHFSHAPQIKGPIQIGVNAISIQLLGSAL